MVKKNFSIIGLLTFAYSLWGQSYSNDVEVLSKDQNTIVVRSSGIHVKKKEASEMAIKSAFYAYFFTGISGVNNGDPLLGKESETKYQDYLERFFEGGRYNNFVRKSELIGEPEKLRSKDFRASVRLEMANDALLRDLELNKVLVTKSDVIPTTIELPSIMVVPYRKDGETFADLLQGDPDKRIAMTVVQNGFVEKGVETVDFETKYRAVQRRALHETNAATSLDAELISSSGADVYVEVDIVKDVNAEGAKVSLNLKANETATGQNLASETYISNRFRTSATDKLCYYAVKDVQNDFLQKVAVAMAKKVVKGNTVVLEVTLSESASMNFDTEVGELGFPLGDVLRMWVKKNAKGGSFHVQGVTAEKVIFDRIQVPNRSESNEVMDANDFALNLFLYLKKQNIACEKKVEGNTIYIKIVE